MKILLTAINAKYIHSNLAVYSLRAYAQSRVTDPDTEIALAEYTINQQTDDILMDIYRRKPDVLCFSCYIWNISYVENGTSGSAQGASRHENLVRRTGGVLRCDRRTKAFAGSDRRDERRRRGDFLLSWSEGLELVGLQGITWRREDGEIYRESMATGHGSEQSAICL